MSDQSEGAVKSLGLFSTLQAATEVQFFLLSMTFALLIDNVFTLLNQPGLWELAENKEALNPANLTLQILFIFILFSFLTSLALRFLAIIVDELYIHTVGIWIGRFGYFIAKKLGVRHTQPIRDHNHVSPSELREEAHRTQDKYYLDLYKEYEKNWATNRQKVFRLTLYSFFCLTMLCINFYIGHIDRKTITHIIENYFKSSDPIWITIIVLVFMVFWRFYRDDEIDSIYCPNLYDKLKKQKQSY